MQKKVKLFGKEISVFLIVAIAIIGLGAAALIPYFGIITGTATVSQGLVLDGGSYNVPITENFDVSSLAAKQAVSNHYLENLGSVGGTFSLSTNCETTATDCSGITNSYEYPLAASGTSPREDRVSVSAVEAGVTTLNSLSSISWDVASGTGYAPHVDVYLDNGKVLVFEYAKVDAGDCDNVANYPTGNFNTFKEKGAIGDASYAWLSSGPAGPCGDSTFDSNHKSLADWKTSDGGANILRFEFEVDSWIYDSSATLSGIQINGNSVDASYLGDGDRLDFNLIYDFAQLLEPGIYTINTTVNA